MKNNFLLLLILCFIGISNAFGQAALEGTPKTLDSAGQTVLEDVMKDMKVTINLSPLFKASDNKYPTYITKDKTPLSINKAFDLEPTQGDEALKVIFGTVSSILTHQNYDCKVLVNAFGEYSRLDAVLGIMNKTIEPNYNRIKTDFRFGKQKKSATKEEIEELNMMVKHYSQKEAKKMFNANEMLMYPLSLRGNIWEDKYTRCSAVVAIKNRSSIFFYFIMTDESVKNFDQYLNDLSGSFMFN